MEIQCSFELVHFHGENIYGCVVKNQNIPENCNEEFIGNHMDGKTNEDVLIVHLIKCTVTKIPKGLTKIFPNLTKIDIEESKLTNITKSDLQEYKNLDKFRCVRNEVEFLPSDLFEGFKRLESISFFDNKLKVIHPNILDGLEDLNYVYFERNPNYEKWYSNYPGKIPGNASLEEVKNELFDKYPHKYEYIKDLKTENQQLKETNINLSKELEQKTTKIAELTLKTQIQFLDDLKAFTQDETTKDFQIQIDNHEFPVHKFLLAARSPTLAEILKNNPEVENLNLVDISVDIFEIILKFLYTDELPDDDSNFLHLFAAAGKLKIEKLKNYAAQKIIDNFEDENAVELLNLSNKYDQKELRQKSFEQVKKNYPKIIFKDKWEQEPETVTKIIEVFIKKEEAIKKLEDEFENVRISQ